MSYKIENGKKLPPPVRVRDEGEGASDEVQQWALLQEDALGPRWHSRGRIPCAPRFQGGDVAELDSVILIVAEEATLGSYGVVPFLSDRNTGIASHLRPFRIFATLYLYTCSINLKNLKAELATIIHSSISGLVSLCYLPTRPLGTVR